MALRFDLSDLNPPTWFEHSEDSEARICLRVASGDEFDKIRKQTTKKVAEFRRGQRFEVEKVNEAKRSALTWQYCIVDWEGVQDKNGMEITCTDENKVLLMQGAPKFASWITECIEELTEDHREIMASAEKN